MCESGRTDRPGMIFDSHVHAGRWVSPDFRGHETSLARTAEILHACGISGALVMPTDSGDNVRLAEEVAGYAGPVSVFKAAWAVPDDRGLRSLVKSGDYRAIKIHPSFCRVPVTSPDWKPALQLARDFGLPVVVHCGRWQEVAGYRLLLEAARSWPEVDFIMAHMGGDSPGLVLGAANETAAQNLSNVYLGTESIREYWVLAEAIGIVGARRVLFGSDHNLNPPAAFLAVMDAVDMDRGDRALVMGENARRLFRIDDD